MSEIRQMLKLEAVDVGLPVAQQLPLQLIEMDDGRPQKWSYKYLPDLIKNSFFNIAISAGG